MVVQRETLDAARRRRTKLHRIIWLTVGGVLAVFIALYAVYSFTDAFRRVHQEISSAPLEGGWTMFHRDMLRTGGYGNEGGLPSGELKWTFAAGDAIHSSPAVVEGTVYFGSRDSRLYALDAATGALKWSFRAGSWVDSSPAVADGVVYFGCNDGKLYALDAATGVKLWEFSTPYAVRSSPAVADGVVYIGSDDGNVYAVDAATGKEIWRAETGDNVVSSPAVAQGIVIAGSMDGSCYFFNAKTGEKRLRFDTYSMVNGSPAARDGVAYVIDTAGSFYVLDIMKKNWLGEHKTLFYWDWLYLYRVAPRPPLPSGFIWGKFMGMGINTASSVALAESRAYFAAGGDIYSLDLTAREVAWKVSLGDRVTSSPAVAGDAIFIGGENGRLYALDKDTGAVLWEAAAGGKITSSPAVVNGTVYIGSHDGKMYAFD